MSSEISTDRSTFRPWHFFVLTALIAATAGVLMAQDTTPSNLVLVSLAIGSAALAGLAFYRTLAPLAGAEVETMPLVGTRARAALEREKTLLLRSIKELEFDRAMGKIAEPDFEEMVGRLRARAITLMKQLDQGTRYSELIERELQARLASLGLKPAVQDRGAVPIRPAPALAAVQDARSTDARCEICQTSNDHDARFCKQCGHPLSGVEAHA